jgi:2-phosphosulfolactate phosphatase
MKNKKVNISVIPYASAATPEHILDKTVVVIDVLRATSVMITALANGVDKIIPVESKEYAVEKAKKLLNEEIILGGEEKALKIDGFHFDNSPLNYKSEKVKGKTLIITTTNGTKALNRSINAKEVYIGAFLNVDAVVNKLKTKDDVVLFCSGTNNNFSLDDGVCAAMIIDKLSKNISVNHSDMSFLLQNYYLTSGDNISDMLKKCFHLNLLIKKGFKKDVEYCLEVNKFDFVPMMNKNMEIVKL